MRLRAAVVLLAAVVAGCGARTELRDREDAATVDAPDVVPVGQPCGCPGTPAFRYCQLPLMCCPVMRTCENPSTFSCTGSSPPPCP